MCNGPLCITPVTITDKNFCSKKGKDQSSKYTKNLPENQKEDRKISDKKIISTAISYTR